MAFGKGLPTRRVIPVHILRNSLIPVTTSLAADFGILIVGATVTEGIFNIPGVGGTLFRAIKLRRESDRRLVRDGHGHPVSDRQPDHRPALRGPRPEDPLCQVRIPTRRAPHFVAPVDDAALGAVDAVRVSERKSNLWLDAWRDLRSRPMFWISSVLIVLRDLRRAVPRPLHGRAAERRVLSVADRRPPVHASNGPPGAGSPARLHQAGLRHLLAHRPRHGDLALGRPHRDRPGRVHGHRDGRPRRLLRRLGRLAAHAPRRHLLRDPLHPGGGRRDVGLLGLPQRVGDLARHRRLRLAIHRAHPEIRGAAHQAVRLRHGVDGARGLAPQDAVRPTCCRTRSPR